MTLYSFSYPDLKGTTFYDAIFTIADIMIMLQLKTLLLMIQYLLGESFDFKKKG